MPTWHACRLRVYSCISPFAQPVRGFSDVISAGAEDLNNARLGGVGRAVGRRLPALLVPDYPAIDEPVESRVRKLRRIAGLDHWPRLGASERYQPEKKYGRPRAHPATVRGPVQQSRLSP